MGDHSVRVGVLVHSLDVSEELDTCHFSTAHSYKSVSVGQHLTSAFGIKTKRIGTEQRQGGEWCPWAEEAGIR